MLRCCAFSTRVLGLSLFISVLTALLVFLSLYFFMVRPMQRITAAMTAFRANPEDPARILHPSSRRDEIGTAERELSTMQHELYGFLQQKTRLAALGLAVAKIQHDLRNILSSAQIASDRLATIEDPVVKRVTPRLVDALDRAVALATNTLRFGKAEERTPQRARYRACAAGRRGGGIGAARRTAESSSRTASPSASRSMPIPSSCSASCSISSAMRAMRSNA